MRKLGLGLIALAAIAVLGLPPVLGMLTQSRVEARVTALANHPVITARVVSYERGWFSSVARIELATRTNYARADALGASTPQAVLIRVDFAHGPIAALDGAHFGLSSMVARPDPAVPNYAGLLGQLGVPYLFELRARTAFNGTVEFDADAPPVEVAVAAGTFRFSGARLEGALRGRALAYDVRIDAVSLDAGSGGFRLERFTATGDNELHGSVPLGPADLAVERLWLTDAAASGRPALDAANVRMHSNFALDANGTLVNGMQTFTVDSVTIAPDSTLRAATLELEYRNLDADALEAYSDALQRSAATGALDPNAVLTAATPAVERLLAAQPSFAIDPLRFSLNDQTFDARLGVTTRPAALPPAGALDLRDPGLWLDVLVVDAEVTIGKELATALATQVLSAQFAANDPELPPEQIRYMAEAQVGLVLVTLLGQGLIVDQGDAYAARVSFGDGALTVNGAALPLGLP